MQTRNLGEISFTLYDQHGNCREIESEEEFNFLINLFCNIKTSIPFIMKKSIMKLDLLPPFFLASLFLKKLLKKEVNAERAAIFDRLEGISKVKIKFRAKELTLMCTARTFNLLYQVFVRNQYDISEQMIKGKIIADVGANIGDFSLFCAFFGPKRVYAFEPMQHTFGVLQHNIAENGLQGIIVPVQKGLGSKNERIRVPEGIDAYFGAGEHAGINMAEMEIVTLDSFLEGEKDSRVDLIKMDVEGYEEDVLLGSAKTIKKFKPILTFSAYHKPTDKTRLPEVVKSIREDYGIKLNKFYEEDFFCD